MEYNNSEDKDVEPRPCKTKESSLRRYGHKACPYKTKESLLRRKNSLAFIGEAILLMRRNKMEYRFLSQNFYSDYPVHLFPELEHKADRPYTIICITLNNFTFALPMRSHISHKYAYITDKIKMCGVDYSKAVYISKKTYIDYSRKPYIRQNEFDFLRGKEYILETKFIKYMKEYTKAQKSLDPNRMRPFAYSTLHYFEPLVDYERDILIPLMKKEVSPDTL